MNKADEVYRFVAGKIQQLSQKGSWQTAMLAKLRRGIGKAPGETPEIWELTIAELPEALTSFRGCPSDGEWAAHLALTLFALHQQGKSTSVSGQGNSFGRAVSLLRASDGSNEAGIKRRFDATLTAKNLKEFSHHARGLVQLMKAKDVVLDYPLFAKDIFWLQNADVRRKVCLRWAEDYYRVDHQESER